MRVEALFNNKETPTIEEYLKRCGVTYPNYLNPKADANEPFIEYDNIDDAVELLNKAINQSINYNKWIVIVCDSDCDGYCSSAMAKRFLLEMGVQREYIFVLFHDGKQHGLSRDILKQINKGLDAYAQIALIWLPDAGTNDVEACGYYTECYNIPILITDHHIADRPNGYGLVVNNQTSDNVQNKNLCGTGVTHKVISAYCKKHNSTFHQNVIDLVALATISDVMDMRSAENRLFVWWGFRHVKTTFIRAMCDEFIMDDFSPTSVAWNIVPKINAVCRSNDQELKQELFNALCDDVWDEGLFDKLRSCHQKQRNEVDKVYNELLKIHPIGDKVKIFIYHPTPYTGLVANKLSDYYGCPVMVVHESHGVYTGSLRSPCYMKTQLKNTGLMTLCTGHECACGVGWREDDTEELLTKCNQLDFAPAVKQVTYSTDNVLIGSEIFDLHDNYMEIWGQGIPEPTVHFEGITISGQDIKELGANKTTIKFLYGDIEFIMFYVSKEKKELTNVGRNVIMNMEVIGTPSINRFRDKETKQIVIKEMEVK